MVDQKIITKDKQPARPFRAHRRRHVAWTRRPHRWTPGGDTL